MNKGPTVFVGLSGGVDSSVAALRLKKRGFNVVGVFIKVWHPDFMVCNWEAERLDAMRVAAHLNIPFLTCDAENTYRDFVAQYFIEEYQAGRTPNPDVLCNKEVKFGAFLAFAKSHQADYIATGHYARKIESADGARLYRGIDSSKDQSYFLWSLSNEQLNYALFPIGDTTKEEVRREAKQAQIPTATKRDSQGVCFLGHIDIPEFISHYTTLEAGAVLDESGKIIGQHEGALVYTIGQRHGFTIKSTGSNASQHYVTKKDLQNNTITVSATPPKLPTTTNVHLQKCTFRQIPNVGDELQAQFRYRQNPFKIKIEDITADSLTVSVLETVDQPAAGQSCVIYDHDHCLGGGILK